MMNASPATTVSFSKMIENGEDEAFLALAAEAPERLDSWFETPLADAIRELCAARRPWTFGAFFGPGMTVDSDDYTTRIDVRDGTEWRTTILKRYTPRFRSFMTELFSLLAAPVPHAEPAEGAKEPAP